MVSANALAMAHRGSCAVLALPPLPRKKGRWNIHEIVIFCPVFKPKPPICFIMDTLASAFLNAKIRPA